ncbi:MAG: HEAT repeat domain-containing protein [Candidatus Neomarinimicrobiota bacterium]
MKRLKHIFCAVFITMIATSFLFGFAKSDEEKIEAFRSSKIVTVIVETKILKTDFEQITKNLLSNYCGVQVSENELNLPNVLRIKAKGKQVKESYMKATPDPEAKTRFQLSDLPWNANRPFGAKLSGRIYLEVSGKTILKHPFKSYIPAPEWAPGILKVDLDKGKPSSIYFNPDFWRPDTTSWKQDPFKRAFRTFISSLIEVLGKVYGINMLVSVFEDKDIAIIDEYDSYIRIFAAQHAGKLKDPRAVEYLIIALNDKDFQIRSYAVAALYYITEEKFGHNYDKWRIWWEQNKEVYKTN